MNKKLRRKHTSNSASRKLRQFVFALGCVGVVLVLGALKTFAAGPGLDAVFNVSGALSEAQEPSESTAAATLESLRKAPDVLKGRAATLRSRLVRKRSYLIIVNARLSKARAEGDEKLRAHKLSFYSYQSFLISSHIAAEENKLKEVEALTALRPDLSQDQLLTLIKKELAVAVRNRFETVERLLMAAERYRPAITEATYKQQFERLVASIRADRKKEDR